MSAVNEPSQPLVTVASCLAGLCLGVMILGGCHKSAPDAPAISDAKAAPDETEREAAAGVSLESQEIERLGITTVEAKAATRTQDVPGYGVILAHEALAQSVSELLTAAATQRQSSAALARIERLVGTPGAMGADAQETAERQDAVDRASLNLARQKSSTTFGQHPPWRDDFNSATLQALANGQIKLVRVTFPLGSLADKSPTMFRLARLSAGDAGRSWESTTVWDAPADANVPGRSFFALLKAADASEGERLLAWALIGEAQAGVEVPAAAVIISGGQYWCYVEDKPGHFVRVELGTGAPVHDGYFVTSGIAAGDKVVTHAAGLLLARETNPSSAAVD